MPAISIRRASAAFVSSQKRIWTRHELFQLIQSNLAAWIVLEDQDDAVEIPPSTSTAVLNILLKETSLAAVSLRFPYRPVTRYVYGDASTFGIVQSVDEQGYFSHYTAMQLHGLTDQLPKSIYFNVEQPATGGGGTLTQAAIDRAFKAKCRVTNNVIEFRDQTINKVNGQNTGRLGVIERSIEDGSTIHLTDIERTLIDIAVRPIYSGGIAEVANAYRAAADQVSTKRLLTYLKALNYTYPYHQAIGFYMTRAGNYRESDLAKLRRLPMDFDFYLTYQLKNPVLNSEWRLYVPKGF